MASNYVDRTIKIPASQPTVTLDPDKYLGTIGLAADAPTGKEMPHYTAFPVDPKKGNWLQVVSEATIAGKSLLKGEEWYCATAKTDTSAVVWARSQVGEKQPLYESTAQNIGEIRAFLYNNAPVKIGSGKNIHIEWGNLFGTGIHSDLNRILKTNVINITPSLQPNIENDFYAHLVFAKDRTGIRWGTLQLYSYYPEGNEQYAIPLEEFIVRDTRSTAEDPLSLTRPGVLLPTTEPLDDTPLNYGISCYVKQDSGNDLNLIYAELKVKSYYKKY